MEPAGIPRPHHLSAACRNLVGDGRRGRRRARFARRPVPRCRDPARLSQGARRQRHSAPADPGVPDRVQRGGTTASTISRPNSSTRPEATPISPGISGGSTRRSPRSAPSRCSLGASARREPAQMPDRSREPARDRGHLRPRYNHAGGGFDPLSLWFYDRAPNGNQNNSLFFTDQGWAGGFVFFSATAWPPVRARPNRGSGAATDRLT